MDMIEHFRNTLDLQRRINITQLIFEILIEHKVLLIQAYDFARREYPLLQSVAIPYLRYYNIHSYEHRLCLRVLRKGRLCKRRTNGLYCTQHTNSIQSMKQTLLQYIPVIDVANIIFNYSISCGV